MQMTDNIIMSGSEDASIKMLDLNSGKVVNTFNGHVWGVACLQFKDNYIVRSATHCARVDNELTVGCVSHFCR